jgi:hypothetical protein
MDITTFYQACEQLLDAGWELTQIERLCQFRDNYVQTRLDQAELDIRHLEFIRWLVLTGRLSDW